LLRGGCSDPPHLARPFALRPIGEMQSVAAIYQLVEASAVGLREQLSAVEAKLVAVCDEEAAFRQVESAINDCLTELESTGLWGVENRIPSSVLWNEVGEILCRGWLQNQARIKPRGYAGDYEMLARIYENRLCDDPLGRLFDRYFQEQAAPQAVRNRMRMMRDWIAEWVRQRGQENREQETGSRRPLQVAIVGSAFGSEVGDAVRMMTSDERQHLAIALFDMDPAALEFARQQLEPLLPAKRLRIVPTNVFRLAERTRLAEPLAGTDLLLCPGLFDYLDDGQAAAILRVFWERLSPGGRMEVFQFAPHNPTRAYMEWLGNWYLVYRDAEQLRSLANSAGIPLESATISSEPLGVNLLLTAVRP
jgi:extracellular factor (EF) 3-hydroxypalmitic acid methyl ester biosynthesis protein